MKDLDFIIEYIRSGENDQRRLGLELEHFVLNAWNESISFNNLSGLMEKIGTNLNAELIRIDGHVMGYKLEEYCATMEPACQLEISISPYDDLNRIKNIYGSFYNIWREALRKEDFRLITKGVDPRVESGRVEPTDLSIIPKKRYHYMDKYFQTSGKYGRHMMRASASTQISLDYSSEKDLVRKLRVLEKVSPFLMILMENKSDEIAFIEDREKPHLLRTQIWDNLDNDRCGFLPGSLDENFGYESYAKLLLSNPLVVFTRNGETSYAGEKTILDIDGLGNDTVEHLISMFFFHIRIKKYLEVRVADSVSIDKAIGYAALLKGLMYNEKSLKKLEALLEKFQTIRDINNVIDKIEKYGYEADIDGNSAWEYCKEILNISSQGLDSSDRKYLKELINIFEHYYVAV